MTAVQPQEIRGEALMGQKGRPVEITSTNKLAPTVLHQISAVDLLDALYVEVFNRSEDELVVHLVLAPTDTASTGPVDAATVSLRIEAKNSVIALQGLRFRSTGQSYVLAAYCDAGAEGELAAVGVVNRLFSPEVTL